MKKDKRIEREQGDVNTTRNRREYWKRNLKGESKRWFDEDQKYFLHQSMSTPVLNVLSRAQGAYIEDLDGKKYIDMHGNGVHNAGFNNPAVIEAVKKQLEENLTFCPRRYTNIPAIELAKKLAEITPGDLCRSLFCPGGSEAIEMALMLAKQVTGRFKTISYWDSFHGAGMGAANDLKDRHPLIGHVAGLGLHLGIDLVSDQKTKARAVDEAEIIMFKCLERGLSAKTIEGNVLTLRPALVITREEMDRAIDIIDEAIGEVEGGKKY